MVLTLNQITKRIETLALSHDQISSFFFGRLPDFEATEIDYGAFYLEQLPGVIDRANREMVYSFRAYIVDLTPPSENTRENETEVLSDTHSIAADFLAMLNYTGYQDDWWIGETSAVTPIVEGLADFVAGVQLEFEVKTEYLADRCQVPATDVTFENDFDMARTRILTYTGTGSEGSSFNVTNLAGKIVLAVYRAGGYKRAITTTPTDSDKIKVAGTDLGERKGILASTGGVELQTGDALVSGEIVDFLIFE